MKKYLLLTAAHLVSGCCVAQVALVNSPYKQDFNTIGTGLPLGWSVRTGATSSSLGNAVSFSTTNAAWTGLSGNFKNYAGTEGLMVTSSSAEQSASANRALGIRQTGTFGDPGAAFVFHITKTTGLSNFVLRFKLQSLDGLNTGRTTTWRVDFAFGSSPASFSVAETRPATLATVLSPGGWGSTPVEVDFGNALDNRPMDVWIRIIALAATTGSGSRPSVAIDDFQLSFEPDVAPPLFTPSWPKIYDVTASGCDLAVSLSEAGTTYFVVLPGGANAPGSLQVKNKEDGDGTLLGEGFYGEIALEAPSTEYKSTISSLKPSTSYDVYFASEDWQSNLQVEPLSLNLRTLALDTIAPSFLQSYPRIDHITPNDFSILVRLSEAGKFYFVIVPSEAPEPNAIQVKNGTDANTNRIPGLAGAMQVTDTLTQFEFVIHGLKDDSPYDIYLVAEDKALNLQLNPVKVSVTTGRLFTENFETCASGDSFTQFNVAGDQVWECTDFGKSSWGMRINGFSGRNNVNEDWLISPLVRLENGSGLSFYSQFFFSGDPLQLKISTDYAGYGHPASANWHDLHGNFPLAAAGSGPTDWSFSRVDLSAFANQSVHVAFVYTSTELTAARWSLDSVTFSNATSGYLLTTPSTLSLKADRGTGRYELKGFNLKEEVKITAPSGFEVSKNNQDFSNSIAYTATEVQTKQTVFVRFAPTSGAPVTGDGFISNASLNVAPRMVAARGADVRQTFDVATYNLDFFGSDVKSTSGVEFGPINDALQISHVATVLQAMEADIIAVEEVSDDNAFANLVAALPGYDGILSNRWSYSFDPADPAFPPQKIGLVYDKSTVHIVSARVLFERLYDDIKAGTYVLPSYPGGNSSGFWASGRLPFMVLLNAAINGVKRNIRVIIVHAKSGTTTVDYDRRKYDVQVLHDSIVTRYPNDAVMILGDFNDDVDQSIVTGGPSSWQSFIQDAANFNGITYELSRNGALSFPDSRSFLDHIVVSDELSGAVLHNAVFIEEARDYVDSYINTTSDHLPVLVRFLLEKVECLCATVPDGPVVFTGDLKASANQITLYPNPVMDDAELIGIEGDVTDARLFDMSGRMFQGTVEKKGPSFFVSAGHLSSGIYLLLIYEGSVVYKVRFSKK